MSSGGVIPWVRGLAAATALFWGTACFSEPDSTSESSADESTGTTGTTASDTTSADVTTGTSPLDETTTSLGPDSSEATSSSGGSSGPTGGDSLWRCVDQDAPYACESFEADDDVGAAWTEEPVSQVVVSQDSDPTSGSHRHYVLDGADGMQAKTSLSLDLSDVQTLHIEFATRVQTSIDDCSTGTGGDLTMFSMSRSSRVGPDEQLILQVGPTHATLYSTGIMTADVIVLQPSEEANEWFQVALDLDVVEGDAALRVGGASGTGVQSNWLGLDIQQSLEMSFGPGSDNDGDTFNDCQFDIDNVLVTFE